MAQHNFTANIKFRYDAESDHTYLLVRFPGESWYTKIASKAGQVSRDEAFTLVQCVSERMAQKGYGVMIEDEN